jgi:hypothetical protein
MDQNQTSDTGVNNPTNTHETREVISGIPLAQGSPKPIYLLAASIVIGCLILATAYIHVQTTTVEKDVVITVPANIEENEPGLPFSSEYTAPNEIEAKDLFDTEPVDETFIHTLRDDQTDYRSYYTELVSQDGVVWLDHPQAVGDLGLFSVTEDYQFKDKKFQYYHIANVNDEPLYVTFVPYCEMGCSNSMFYFVANGSGTYTYLEAQSTNNLASDYFGFTLSNAVTTDREFVLAAHQVPKEIEIDGVSFTGYIGSGHPLGYGSSFFADSYYNLAGQETGIDTELIAVTEYGPAFRGLRDINDGNTRDLDYAIRLAGGLMMVLEYEPDFIWDDRVPRIGWLDGTNNESPYRTDGLSGCGGGGPEVMAIDIPQENLLLAGYTIAQEPIYVVTDPNHFVITRLFTEGDLRNYYEYNPVTGETETKQITKSDFINERGVIIYIDPFGLQHVMTHTKYGPQAECAKPVIYLYPEDTTQVRVTLDALVTVSEPNYNSGWDVVAHPDGTLVVGGATFESLFWDGYGNGVYPEFSEGFVVPTENALDLMATHLTLMGFNEKEVADFVAFWEPHMPSEPYTRFSWIGTIGMEQLAKLTITPPPDTLIRAFVDFEGLHEPIAIAPQTIPTYERKGFVATEWGGLLQR